MNRTLDYKTVLAIAALLAVVGAFSIMGQRPWLAFGNVGVEDVLVATTTPSVADRTNLCPQGNFTASSTTGTLGSVLITGPNLGALRIYDATTTNASLRSADQATSSLLLVEFPTLVAGNATTTGNFPVNARFNRGLLVDYDANVSTSTITYRCGS